MLRITQALELKLKKTECLFSLELLKGSGLAISLHLLLFAIFRIAGLPNSESSHPLSPIAVEVDLSQDPGDGRALPLVKREAVVLDVPENPSYFDNYYEMRALRPRQEGFALKLMNNELFFSSSQPANYIPLPHLLEEEDDCN
jgi:hypothetical protein